MVNGFSDLALTPERTNSRRRCRGLLNSPFSLSSPYQHARRSPFRQRTSNSKRRIHIVKSSKNRPARCRLIATASEKAARVWCSQRGYPSDSSHHPTQLSDTEDEQIIVPKVEIVPRLARGRSAGQPKKSLRQRSKETAVRRFLKVRQLYRCGVLPRISFY